MHHLRRKLTLRAHGEQVVYVKRKHERIEHVWMKAFLWALYLPSYPGLQVEIDVGDKYKPDVVALDERRGRPRFWGEAGQVGPEKIDALLNRHPRTHFAIAKWAAPLDPVLAHVEEAIHDVARAAPVDLLSFPADSAERFITKQHTLELSFAEVDWIRVGNAEALE